MLTRRLAGTTVALALAVSSLSALPWIKDMWVGPVVMPQTRTVLPPEDTLSVDGPQLMNRIDARDKLTNPVPASAEVLAEGANLYRIYCASCHGPDARGDGVVAEHFRRMPDLTAANVQNYADGWLYTIIRQGGFSMPPFGFALDIDERWALVHHLKALDD